MSDNALTLTELAAKLKDQFKSIRELGRVIEYYGGSGMAGVIGRDVIRVSKELKVLAKQMKKEGKMIDEKNEASSTTEHPPGHPEAVAAGCTCPTMDNGNGAGNGYVDKDGNPCFWYSYDCPIHANSPMAMKDTDKVYRVV